MIFYTGSYTQEGAPASNPRGKGIGCFALDIENGSIKQMGFTQQRNPSYMVVSENKKFLYAVEEMFEDLNPAIHAYGIGKNGELKLLNKQALVGDYACHLAIIKDRLVVANYVSGNAVSYPINEDGSLAPHSQIIQHEGMGPNEERQEVAHAHMIYPFEDNQMYVVDLSLDKAKAYHMQDESGLWLSDPENDIKIEAGSGARHMLMNKSGDIAYILSELSGEIFVANKKNGSFTIEQKTSFVPDEYEEAIGGAALRMHPNGKLLYASCRGADTIAIFKIDEYTNEIRLVAYQSTEGETPRDFNIDPTGQWLIAANQDSNSLVVFKINTESGMLTMHSEMPVDTPVNITWLN